MIQKIKRWFKGIVKELLRTILKEEYFISTDIGIKETEIMVLKYSYRTGNIEVISDNLLQKTPLQDIEKEIRFLIRKYNASAIADYPREAKDLFNLRRSN